MGADIAALGGPAVVAAIVAALAAATAVLARSPRRQAIAMAVALAVAPFALVAHVWETPQFAPLRANPLAALVLGAAALALLAGAAWLISRRPAMLPVATLAAIPFRVPIESAGTSSNLLVPLYLVVGGGALAYVVTTLRGAEPDRGRRPGAVEWLAMGLVVMFALQSLYSVGAGKALEQVVFFYVPFALLYALLVRVEWSPRLLTICLGTVLGLALVFCAVGFVEFGRRELLLNPQVVASNQFQSYFRVSSLFFDPNIFGRFLAVVMIAVAAVMIWATRARDVAGSALALAVLWCGLVLTLSQSSLGALLVGLAVLAALRWSAGWTAALTVAALAVAMGIVLIYPAALRLQLDSQDSVQSATSGRGNLIAGGVELFARRPVTGWGSAAFETQYRRQERVSGERAVSASHTIPITVAAEQGVLGLALYLGLVVCALMRLLRGARGSPARAAIAAAFAALVLHTLLYAAFLEDPLAWALLAIGTALAWRERPGPDRHPAELLRAG